MKIDAVEAENPRSSSVQSLILDLPRYQILIAVLLVLLAVGSEVWQPFVLGFEHDDWFLFVRPHMLRDFSDYHPDRPGYYWLSWIILHVWDGSRTEFQWIKVVINLASAISVFWLALSMQRLFRVSSPVLAISAATLWLIAPWGLGYTVWATAAFTNIAMLYFCVSMILFVRFVERGSWWSFALSILLWAISIETYQATWFAFVPLTFAVLLAVHDRVRERNRTLVLAAFLLAVQLGNLVHTALTTPKSQHAGLIQLSLANAKRVAQIHISYLGPWLFLLVVAVTIGFVVAAKRDVDARRLGLRRLVAGLTMAVLGSCGSAAIYAAAGYAFGAAGEASKTSGMFTFWVALGFSLALSVNIGERLKSIVGIATSVSVIVVTFLSYPGMARPWVTAWKQQREVLETIKGQSFPRRLEPGDVVLGDLPVSVDGVPVFGAPWSIGPAALAAWEDVVPALTHQAGLPVQIVPLASFNLAWEAGKLSIAAGWFVPAKRIWLWKWKTGDAVLANPSGRLSAETFDSVFEELKRGS